MIHENNMYFRLDTKGLTYLFRVMETGQLEHLYLGNSLIDSTYEALHTKITAGAGSSIEYENNGHKAFLDMIPLEYSGIGKGDFRLTPLEVKMPDGTYVTDFVYHSYEISKGSVRSKQLPTASEGDESLIITMKDRKLPVMMKLIYTVFYETNVITRRIILENHDDHPLNIRKIMSLMMDFYDAQMDLYTFGGGWIKEAHKHKRTLSYGTYIHESTTGSSSNRHMPGIILAKKNADEDHGICIGINLVYSGNHYEAVNLSNHGLLRVMTGINPHCFEWELKKGETFETPEAVLSFSDQGFNGLSYHFHQFVDHHIVPKPFSFKQRPVVINSWEAFFFEFNHRKLINLAKQAKALGVELFVLDDGWFGHRNDDTTSLGDYSINRKKLPFGLKKLADQIRAIGLDFGLWFEPEMISEKSELYQKHPEYAIQIPGRNPSLGRNQLVLNLTNPDVRRYILSSLYAILDDLHPEYMKWDMNRHLTDMFSASLAQQGMFFHAYILGLYEILTVIQKKYPNMLIETCSSGGNRFDLGMLTFGAQVWSSDDTDPIERLKIQEGLSYLYPLSTMSNHVSLAPHAQTLRMTPLSTRFNVSSFGVLGYELNFKYLSHAEKSEIKAQIAYYKEHRKLFQQGRFQRLQKNDAHHIAWQVSLSDEHMIGEFQTLAEASPTYEMIKANALDPKKMYRMKTFDQKMPLSRFGHLIVHALPLKLHPYGTIMRMIGQYKMLDNAKEDVIVSGEILMNGYKLKQQFMGTYYNDQTRLIGDFGSMLYHIKPTEEESL